MPNTIVWATDGSEHAIRALARARDILPDGDALIAVHIVQDPSPSLPGSPTPSDLVGRIHRLVLDVSNDGHDVALKVANHVDAQPARAIADIAREVGADLIIVGTRGYSPIHSAFVGSVAQALLHLAPCPVLAVPPLEQSTGRHAGETSRGLNIGATTPR